MLWSQPLCSRNLSQAGRKRYNYKGVRPHKHYISDNYINCRKVASEKKIYLL